MYMKVKDVIEHLSKFDPEAEVLTKKTDIGNVGYVRAVKGSSYGFFGKSIPCVLLTDERENEEE